MATPNGNHSIKRIQLPSGKTIEVVFFEAAAPQKPDPQKAVDAPRRLHE